MKKYIVFTLLLALAATTSVQAQKRSGSSDEAVGIETLVATEGEKKIITTGYGSTPEAAEQDALRNAVAEAVGSVVSSTTIVENDEVIEDEILSLSHGFVRTHRVLSVGGNVEESFSATIVAIVAQKQIVERLATYGVKISYNAGGIFAQYNQWDNLKEAELTMVNKFFGPEALARRASNVYNYELRAHEPLREDDYYKIRLDVVAFQNSNYQVEFDFFKALLAELCYEVAPLTYQMPTIHLEEGLPEANRYTQKYVAGVDRKGRTKFKTNLIDICEIDAPDERHFINPRYAYGNSAKGEFYTRFVGTESDYLTTQLLYNKYNRQLTIQDISRLNDRQIRDTEVVFDFFHNSYTPYVFVLVEDANVMTPYKRITFYKFVNEESLRVIKNYLNWMFGELHCDIIWQTTEGDKITQFNTGDDCVYSVVNEYDSGVWGDNGLRCRYEGYAFMKPVVEPVVMEQNFIFRYPAEEFKTIRNIELVPHLRVDNLVECIR